MLLWSSSCKDDTTEVNVVAKTKTELLTESNWVLTSAKAEPAISIFGVPVAEFYALMLPCEKDDWQKFNMDNTLILDQGATKCGSDPQTKTTTWSFNADETMLTIDDQEHTLEELSATTLKISKQESGEDYGEDPPKMHKITFKYKHP